jgi:hypothetical protein
MKIIHAIDKAAVHYHQVLKADQAKAKKALYDFAFQELAMSSIGAISFANFTVARPANNQFATRDEFDKFCLWYYINCASMPLEPLSAQ